MAIWNFSNMAAAAILDLISNGHISATGRPIHFMFLWGGVFGDGGSNGAIFDSNKFKIAAAAILDNFETHISATAHDLLI